MMAVAVYVRPFLPVDETRYLAVAWDMWQTGDYLVPHLNGEPYDHKPPLLFWLMNAGWAVFGLNDWWPRLVAPLFGLGSLFLTWRLGRLLWPDTIETPENGQAARLAPVLLLGGAFWVLFTTLTMFDMMLAFFTLLGLYGLLSVWRRGGRFGFVWFALAVGFGVLAKGPAILLHLLPVALLAPVWGPALAWPAGIEAVPRPARGWKSWYVSLLVAVLAGAVMALAWAIPAGIHGGEEYRNAIFWGQSAGRMGEDAPHARPVWWFLAVLPVMLLPWVIWPAAWRSLKHGLGFIKDGGMRFCLIWFLPAFAAFSAIAGKQAHYLLPELAALAMMMAWLLTRQKEDASGWRYDQIIPALPIMVVCLVAIPVPFLVDTLDFIPKEAALFDSYWLGLPVLLGLVIIFWRGMSAAFGAIALTTLMALTLISVSLAAKPFLQTLYNLDPTAQYLSQAQQNGVPTAYYAKYHGQFQFSGRLEKPLDYIFPEPEAVYLWAKAHPNGVMVANHRIIPVGVEPLFQQPFRSRIVAVWSAEVLAKDPMIVVDGLNSEQRTFGQPFGWAHGLKPRDGVWEEGRPWERIFDRALGEEESAPTVPALPSPQDDLPIQGHIGPQEAGEASPVTTPPVSIEESGGEKKKPAE